MVADKVRAVLAEMRIEGLGVIDEATLELDPGLTVVTGETTSGRENMACAFDGTTSSACTSGHTTGPPAENA